jgi:hypothetical protein
VTGRKLDDLDDDQDHRDGQVGAQGLLPSFRPAGMPGRL